MTSTLRHAAPLRPAARGGRASPATSGTGAGLLAAAAGLVGGLAVVMRVLVP